MSSKEKIQHSSISVPYSYYKCGVPDIFFHVPLHWHEEFEINFIISGKGIFKCGDMEFIAKPGDIIIFAPGALHSIKQYDEYTCYYDTLVFNSDMLGISSDDRCSKEVIRPIISGRKKILVPINADNPYYSEMRISTENIFSCAKDSSAQLDLLLKSELMKLFWLVQCSGALTESNDGEADDDVIREVLEYISLNYHEGISVEELAQKVHISISRFMNRFKKSVGMGAIEYVNRIRIRAVCTMLVQKQKSTAEAAFECGFKNLSNFNRLFKKYVGSSPTEYLKTVVDSAKQDI